MNKLSSSDRVKVVACLVEGNSIRATVRMTSIAKNTVVKLLSDLGKACSEYQDKAFRNLSCKRIQCDEIWSFVDCKEVNVADDENCLKGAPRLATQAGLKKKTSPNPHANILNAVQSVIVSLVPR